jgi:glycosyltransferase involved in cell wall biosynthesis
MTSLNTLQPPETLSVIMPNRNHGRFLPRALAALERQTVRATEIIVVDDASTDDSLAVLEAWRGRLPELRIVSLAEHGGAVVALNHGLGLATGDLVYAAAADDVTRPLLFETAFQALADHPTAGVFCAEAVVIDDGHTRAIRPAVGTLFERHFTPADFRRWLEGSDNLCVGVVTIVRRRMMLEAGGYDPALGPFCDSFLARIVCLRHGVVFVPKVLGEWHRSSSGISRTLARDVELTKDFIAEARRRIEADREGIYPPRYGILFAKRAAFNAARLALPDARLAARFADFPPDRLERLSRLPVLGRAAALAALTHASRPMSLPRLLAAKASQALRNALDRTRLAPLDERARGPESGS